MEPTNPANVTSPEDVLDAAIEGEIQAQGLTSPRVMPDQIAALMDRVTYRHAGFHGTTSIIVAAFLDGDFYLGCGHSACVSKDRFDPEIGFKIAKGAAEKVARDKLWELEGYLLRSVTARLALKDQPRENARRPQATCGTGVGA